MTNVSELLTAAKEELEELGLGEDSALSKLVFWFSTEESSSPSPREGFYLAQLHHQVQGLEKRIKDLETSTEKVPDHGFKGYPSRKKCSHPDWMVIEDDEGRPTDDVCCITCGKMEPGELEHFPTDLDCKRCGEKLYRPSSGFVCKNCNFQPSLAEIEIFEWEDPTT